MKNSDFELFNDIATEMLDSDFRKRIRTEGRAFFNNIAFNKIGRELTEDEFDGVAGCLNYQLKTRNSIECMVIYQDDVTILTQQKQIELPPGHYLRILAELFISPQKFERDCEAALADWHTEYFEALDQNRSRVKMTSIRIRHTWGFLKAVGWLSFFQSIGKLALKFTGTGSSE